ncbi:hypothetical protein Pogu_1122 [Pyrobaculum oguniense TE7]|uniref:Uncharacterized protein n=1 Tax=Pyrobaculum oguniense (strain DSM 13380 / JCM 10595 / TE7) TaxID=698757 RepID=H6QA27_PYROT|nr:hypothetical protein Pogu_1122 [Pyrobaculum oguniense TE7]
MSGIGVGTSDNSAINVSPLECGTYNVAGFVADRYIYASVFRRAFYSGAPYQGFK